MITTTSRETIYRAIDIEREYQDNKWSKEIYGREAVDRSLDEYALYIDHYTDKLKKSLMDDTLFDIGGKALDNLRKIAALCVAAMERHGLVERPKNV